MLQSEATSTVSLPSHQALEKEVSDHLRARSAMSDKLKNIQKDVQKALKTLDKEVKHR